MHKRSTTPPSHPDTHQLQAGVNAYQNWKANVGNTCSSAYGGNLHDLARRMHEAMTNAAPQEISAEASSRTDGEASAVKKPGATVSTPYQPGEAETPCGAAPSLSCATPRVEAPVPISAVPCPFCGSTFAGKVEVKGGFRLRCVMCDAQTGVATEDDILKGYWERRPFTPSANVAARTFAICEDHKDADWNQPAMEGVDCILCRLFYLEAQESLLEEWQQRAKRAEDAIAEIKRPLDEQMARLNATVTRLNEENERLRAQSAIGARSEEEINAVAIDLDVNCNRVPGSLDLDMVMDRLRGLCGTADSRVNPERT